MYPMPEMYDDPDDPGREVANDADADAANADCRVEFVEEIPTGHATPLALEVTTIFVDPTSANDDRSALPALAPLALGAVSTRVPAYPTGLTGAVPYADAAEHVTALLDLAWARAVLALGERIASGPSAELIPRDRMPDVLDAASARAVFALAGPGTTDVADRLARSRARVIAQADGNAAREIASLATGMSLPLVELARELELSALATELLITALAPRARREIARLYRALAGEPGRPTCDDALLATLLAGDDARRRRDQVYAELADGAALHRHGVIARDGRGGIEVDDAVLARLRGQPAPRSAATTLREADRALDELVADRTVLRALVLDLAAPRRADDPLRVVLRGRRGSGRHATIAALAARVDRRIACIDATQLPDGPMRAEALRRELSRAAIARAIPVVSGVELPDGADPAAAQIAHVLRAHPGPLVVRTGLRARVPVESGALDIALPALSDADRRRAFATELERHAIPADPELLASRYRLGPGAIARVAVETRRRIERGDDDPAAIADAVARQHIAARLDGAATRVTRLATWDQILLHDELLDGLDELLGRARHRGTVFDDWGYEPRSDAASGLTAVFHGPPGTGKAMAASVVAGELGLELYRVDLVRLAARSAGDAEHILDELFGAAEDGQLALLFTELDALVARRPTAPFDERHGRLLDALAHRLEAFDGLAILSTRHAGALPTALDRLPAMRLGFAIPDEAIRAQLWAAHVSPQIPTAGRLDYSDLACRFALSGGDIRRSALRAAFLAAQDGSALTQSHLERAVLLEIRDRRTLSRGGSLD